MKKVLYGIVLVGVVGVGGLFALGQMSRSGPAPGIVDGRLTPCPEAPNCVSSEADTPPEQRVDPLPLGAWTGLPDAIAAMGGVVTRQDEAYLAAEFTSDIFGFVDDVEFRLAGDAVQVRSGSRVGYSDQGVNRARVTALRDSLGL